MSKSSKPAIIGVILLSFLVAFLVWAIPARAQRDTARLPAALQGSVADAATPEPPGVDGSAGDLGSTQAACPDAYEPDDDYHQARPLLMAERQIRSFDRPGDVDWVVLGASPGVRFVVYTRDLASGVDTQMELYASDANGNINPDPSKSIRSDFDPFVPLGSRIEHAYADTTGAAYRPFYLKIANLGGAGGCGLAYTLVMESPAPTPVPTPTPRVEVRSFYTVPDIIRANEVFEVFVTLQNTGGAAAQELHVDFSKGANNDANFIRFDPVGSHYLPALYPGAQATISQRLRYMGAGSGNLQTLAVEIDYLGGPATPASTQLKIPIYAAVTIVVPTASLEAPLARPNIIVRRNWTTRAGSTAYEPKPVIVGQPFELVLELQNLSQVEARNIRVEFPTTVAVAADGTANNEDFIPEGSSNDKWLTTSLGPDQHALVSQTLRPKQVSDPTAGGSKYQVNVEYDFTYEGKTVRAKGALLIVGIFAQPQPEGVLFVTAETVPAVVVPGERFTLKLKAQNIGTKSMQSVVVNLKTAGILKGASSTNIFYLAELKPGEQKPLPPDLDFQTQSAKLATGSYAIPLALAYEIDKVRMEQVGRVYFNVAAPTPTPSPTPVGTPGLAPTATKRPPGEAPEGPAGTPALGAEPSIEIRSVEPKVVRPGQAFTFLLALVNTAAEPVTQLTLKWDGVQLAPLGSGLTWYRAGGILPYSEIALSGPFAVSEGVPPGVVSVPVELVYLRGGKWARHTKEITLQVEAASGGAAPVAIAPVAVGTARPVLTATPQPVQPAPELPQRPVWLRFILSLLGLGG